MPLTHHPETGTIVICDFHGFVTPEMVKRRPGVVLSPRLRNRRGLCTIVPLSTTPPDPVMPYHYRIHMDPPLPPPYDSPYAWVKSDMLYTVSFDRLFLPFSKKDASGKREYDVRVIDKIDLIKVQECVIYGLGLIALTS